MSQNLLLIIRERRHRDDDACNGRFEPYFGPRHRNSLFPQVQVCRNGYSGMKEGICMWLNHRRRHRDHEYNGTDNIITATSASGRRNPGAKLDVWQTANGTGNVFNVSSTTAGDLLTVLGNGNCRGIGTSTPATKLSIQGTAGANDLFSVASSSGTSVRQINNRRQPSASGRQRQQPH